MYKGNTDCYTESKTDQLCERDLRRSAVLRFLLSTKASQKLLSSCQLETHAVDLEVSFPKPCSSQGGGKPRSSKQMKEQLSSQMTYQGLMLSVVFIMLCRTEADTVTQKNVVKVGGNGTLSCFLKESHDVLQVTWQKKNTGVNENLATYSVSKGVNIVEKYRGRLNFTRLSLNDTTITLWRVRIQDDGCYACIFNTFPTGAIVQDSCLTVYEQLRGSLHYVVSEGNLTATCSANAWPRPVISWIVPKAESEKTEEVVTHPNGTVSVISKLYVNSSTSLAGQLLICRVRHMEEDRDYSVKVKEGRWFSVPWLLTSVTLLVVFVGLVLTVVCCRRRRKKQSESKAS
ncbi:OX-2 membrane glycoprotein-like [Trachemys scripta elegans]|uniref:OX-2 membrane glycoprotein-like n=1 Tax=Trachemys scripta elegans TaxID=31138 RepID=UPI0015542999|nr:OX-2 membrane glycoprotein-like [Trachemys scripta elegans]XP_034647058.1 OX-2 membrane glycoprotein-like [Trachemys scripta elegans]